MAAPLNLKEALELLESGDWFSLEVFTANINQGTGGKLLTIPKARIARNRSESISATAAKKMRKVLRNPNHGTNFTRNIELQNHDIVTIHPILIFKINKHQLL